MTAYQCVATTLFVFMASGCLSLGAGLGDLEKATAFGKYTGQVVARWDPNGRTMTLVEPFKYEDWRGVEWVAPSGSVVDGASIPQAGWSLVGGPFEGKYRDASVIHDVACEDQSRPWKDVHRAFYSGMRASGVDKRRAKLMFAAVYHFGPRWDLPADIRAREDLLEMDAEYLRRELALAKQDGPEASVFSEMTLQEIEEFGKQRYKDYVQSGTWPDGPPVAPRKKP